MRNVTGSQCKLYNNGVLLQYLDSLSINLAAAFWTVWIHHMEKKVITEEQSCLWMDNWTQKDEEKTRKYGPLRWELAMPRVLRKAAKHHNQPSGWMVR